MDSSKKRFRNPKTLFFLVIIIFITAISGCKQEKVELCDKYEEYFNGEGSVFTAKDTNDVLVYSNRKKELYSKIKEVYYSGDYPYGSIYEMKNYDTALFFKVLDLYINDKDKYDEEIGIPRALAISIVRIDAIIKGDVVDKINHYRECRHFTTTYFVKVDSILHSYFPIDKGDTVVIHTNLCGVSGYCESDSARGYSEAVGVKDYRKGEKDLYFMLDRGKYVRAFYIVINKPESKFIDPYCYNSFFRNLDNEWVSKYITNCDKSKLSNFVKKINK